LDDKQKELKIAETKLNRSKAGIKIIFKI